MMAGSRIFARRRWQSCTRARAMAPAGRTRGAESGSSGTGGCGARRTARVAESGRLGALDERTAAEGVGRASGRAHASDARLLEVAGQARAGQRHVADRARRTDRRAGSARLLKGDGRAGAGQRRAVARGRRTGGRELAGGGRLLGEERGGCCPSVTFCSGEGERGLRDFGGERERRQARGGGGACVGVMGRSSG